MQNVARVPSKAGGHEEVDEGVDCCRGFSKKSGNKPVFGRDFLEKYVAITIMEEFKEFNLRLHDHLPYAEHAERPPGDQVGRRGHCH